MAAVLSVLAAACYSAPSVTGMTRLMPVPSRALVAGAESLFVLETARYDFVAERRELLANHCVVDGVATRFEKLFRAPPPRSAIVLLSRPDFAPELIELWRGVPMAVVLPEAVEAANDARTYRHRAQGATEFRWSSLPTLTAQMWLLVSSLDRSLTETVQETIASSWFLVAATNLLAAPQEARLLETVLRAELSQTPGLATLFETPARAGVHLAPARMQATRELATPAPRSPSGRGLGLGGLGGMGDRSYPVTPTLLDAQATSVLEYLIDRQPDIGPALLRGLAQNHTTLDVLRARGLVGDDLSILEDDWRRWVRARRTLHGASSRLPNDTCAFNP